MKEQELRKIADCAVCHKPFGNSGLPVFWRIKIERYGLNLRAVQRQQGLTEVLGSARLAMAMGPDEEMTSPVMDPVMVTICETCIMESIFIPGLILPSEEE